MCQIPLLIRCHPQICYGAALQTLNNIHAAAVPEVPCLLPLPDRHQGGIDHYPQNLAVQAVFSLPVSLQVPHPLMGILWGNKTYRNHGIILSPLLPIARHFIREGRQAGQARFALGELSSHPSWAWKFRLLPGLHLTQPSVPTGEQVIFCTSWKNMGKSGRF